MARSFALLCVVSSAAAAGSPGSEGSPFERVFGERARFDPVLHERVRAGAPGMRHYVDADGDGRPEEVWFIDTAARHPESSRPLLVKAIDEDGDLLGGGEPDLDSDLYVADWKADGTVDAVLDYTDEDGDGDVDQMAFYFPGGTAGFMEGSALRAWWGRDVGDDNLLWYDVGYTYNQRLCQRRTHFGGDEMFVSFALPEGATEWVPFFENPFLFYDRDGDGVTEEVLRICGIGMEVESLRHSFDADDDASRAEPRDFDVSISAWARGREGRARGRSGLRLDESLVRRTELRGIPTGPFLRWDAAPRFTAGVAWERVLLTWDEIDHNVDCDGRADEDERWEGVIARGTDGFPQIGGPSCGPFNKRYELDLAPEGPVRVYFHPADRRVHLHGADLAWLEVDYDLDGRRDMRYEHRDRDGDGVLDEVSFDVDCDGRADDRWKLNPEEVEAVGWSWPEVSGRVGPAVLAAPARLGALTSRLLQALEACGGDASDPVAEFVLGGFPSASEATRRKFVRSAETIRFYLGLVGDRLIFALRNRHGDRDFWARFGAARARGDVDAMRELLGGEFGVSARPPDPGWWSRRSGVLLAPPAIGCLARRDPPEIALESASILWRVVGGRFEFYPKKEPVRVLVAPEPARPLTDDERLLVGLECDDGPGCGGMTLYVGGEARPLWRPAGSDAGGFSTEVVERPHVRARTAFSIDDAAPDIDVRVACTAMVGRTDMPVEVTVEGGDPETGLELGIGFLRLSGESVLLDAERGTFSVWGTRRPGNARIGMGAVFRPERFLRLVQSEKSWEIMLAASPGAPLRHRLMCDLLEARRFCRCPSAADWHGEVRKEAGRVRGAR